MSPRSTAVRCLPALVGLWASLAAAAPASAVADIQQSFDALNYEQAAARAQAKLEKGGLEPEELGTLYFLWGKASAVMGHESEAEELFRRGLEIAPLSLVGTESSPRVARPFRRAQARVNGGRLELHGRGEMLSDGRAHIHADVSQDSGALVTALHVLRPLAREPVEAPGPSAELTFLCGAPPCAYWVTAVDRYGNVLVRAGSAKAPRYVDRPPRPPALSVAPAPPPKPFLRRHETYLWAGGAAAVVALGLGAGFFAEQAALQQTELDKSNQRFRTAQAEDRTRRGLRTSAFVVGGVSAGLFATAVILW